MLRLVLSMSCWCVLTFFRSQGDHIQCSESIALVPVPQAASSRLPPSWRLVSDRCVTSLTDRCDPLWQSGPDQVGDWHQSNSGEGRRRWKKLGTQGEFQGGHGSEDLHAKTSNVFEYLDSRHISQHLLVKLRWLSTDTLHTLKLDVRKASRASQKTRMPWTFDIVSKNESSVRHSACHQSLPRILQWRLHYHPMVLQTVRFFSAWRCYWHLGLEVASWCPWAPIPERFASFFHGFDVWLHSLRLLNGSFRWGFPERWRRWAISQLRSISSLERWCPPWRPGFWL